VRESESPRHRPPSTPSRLPITSALVDGITRKPLPVPENVRGAFHTRLEVPCVTPVRFNRPSPLRRRRNRRYRPSRSAAKIFFTPPSDGPRHESTIAFVSARGRAGAQVRRRAFQRRVPAAIDCPLPNPRPGRPAGEEGFQLVQNRSPLSTVFHAGSLAHGSHSPAPPTGLCFQRERRSRAPPPRAAAEWKLRMLTSASPQGFPSPAPDEAPAPSSLTIEASGRRIGPPTFTPNIATSRGCAFWRRACPRREFLAPSRW